MTTPNTSDNAVTAFTARWQASGAAERANYQRFLSELCEVLDLPRPEPTKPKVEDNAYVFGLSAFRVDHCGKSAAGR